MILDRPPQSYLPASVEINAYRVDERHYGDNGEDTRGDERHRCWLGTKIEKGRRDCANVD